jgi:hypothetical protein
MITIARDAPAFRRPYGRSGLLVDLQGSEP